MSQRHRLLLIAFALIFASVIGFGVYVAEISLDAERTHQAYIRVLESLIVYLQVTHGQWPRSWSDLSAVSSDKNAFFPRPDDVNEIRRRVYIRFDVTASEIAKMNVTDFDVVQQIGPNYGRQEGFIEQLIKTAVHFSERPE